jgi:hypothetical protein
MINEDTKCGCCKEINLSTPQSVLNRPGLSQLAYRAGIQPTFLESMISRLSNHFIEIDTHDENDNAELKKTKIRPLANLTTRNESDPGIALMDAWATVADVLTFYQERIANEGFLRTATMRRSVLELARLIGYDLKNGVASSVWLSFEIENGYKLTAKPLELKVQSQPGPGETPQTFENTEEIELNSEWNKLQIRLKQPQTIDVITKGLDDYTVDLPRGRIYLEGISLNLKRNDIILITQGNETPECYYLVDKVTPDFANQRTQVTFQLPQLFQHVKMKSIPDVSEIIKVIDQHLNSDIVTIFKTPKQQEIAKRAITSLKNSSQKLLEKNINLEDADQALREITNTLSEESSKAIDEKAQIVSKWIITINDKIRESAKAITTEAARQKAEAFAIAQQPSMALRKIKVKNKSTDQENDSDEQSDSTDLLNKPILGILKKPSKAPVNAASMERSLAGNFNSFSDVNIQAAGAFQPNLAQTLATAISTVKASEDSTIRVFVFRATAHPLGYNAAPRSWLTDDKFTSFHEWYIDDPMGVNHPNISPSSLPSQPVHTTKLLSLDSQYNIRSEGWIIILNPVFKCPQFFNLQSQAVTNESVSGYGLSGKSTRIELSNDWYNGVNYGPLYTDKAYDYSAYNQCSFDNVRKTTVYVESEELPLAHGVIETSIIGGDDDGIELDKLYSGLKPGRWLIVEGERDDIKDNDGNNVQGIRATELVMLAEVNQNVKKVPATKINQSYYEYPEEHTLPGDSIHTFIKFSKKLEYSYRRDTVSIYGNVVKATHGESRKEVLGSGDSAKTFQMFQLKQSPLTYLVSPDPSGAKSTLDIYVNDIRWKEASSLAILEKDDRQFVTKTNNEGKTSVIFGDGQRGLRLPTGIENISAIYRNGIGKAGNVKAGQICQLLSRPLGVRGVINPLRSSGGADRESLATARSNAPRSVTSLDRLISVSDYGDFACTFAGIGKAHSNEISDGKREWIYVTIAGADDIPIDEDSDLFNNLLQALHINGDPYLPIALGVRELLLLMISANVSIDPDYLWEPVVTEIRSTMLDRFSFERRELGQYVFLSEIITTIQSVKGVSYVDVDVLGGIPEKKIDKDSEGNSIRRLLTPQEISNEASKYLTVKNQPLQKLEVKSATLEQGIICPAQLAYLSPEIPDLLVINQIK